MLFQDFQWTTGCRKGFRLRRAHERRMVAIAEARWLTRVCGFRL